MEPSALALFCIALLLNAGSPGPSVAALVSRVLVRGWRDAVPFVAAMWVGEVVWLTLATTGLAVIAETFHYAFVAIKYAGVAYLLYLAWRMWIAPTGEDAPGAAAPPARARMFAAGLAVTLGNPKIMLFYLALLPAIVDMVSIGLADWAALSAATIAILMAIDTAYIVLAERARALLRSARARRLANRAGAAMLGGAAAAIAAR